MDLIRDQGFREQRGEYGSRMGGGGGGGGGGEGLDVSRVYGDGELIGLRLLICGCYAACH